MLLTKRTFLITGGAALLTACMGPAASSLNISAQGAAGMNPGADGQDRPVTLTVIQMTGSGAFDSADYVSLQDPQAALGSEYLRADQIVLAPGGTATKVIPVEPTAGVVGVVGGFIDPAGKQVRTRIAAPKGASGVIISVGPGGIALTQA